ncbi:hypothetical protein CDAR_592551 [Caerostris darwini]|uniref:Uncharacterized protein n=1 Tax=Caerostris darwini TaxID=1538125 RepID=A0AAV4WZB6_9ARAC|nr:hypothetical protein CDAR_592551 [Caerostris darwini]
MCLKVISNIQDQYLLMAAHCVCSCGPLTLLSKRAHSNGRMSSAVFMRLQKAYCEDLNFNNIMDTRTTSGVAVMRVPLMSRAFNIFTHEKDIHPSIGDIQSQTLLNNLLGLQKVCNAQHQQ